MLLAQLVSTLAPLHLSGSLDKEITGIAYDSRLVEFGNLFVAISGFVYDGHYFIQEAALRGAVAVIVSKDIPVPADLTRILVTDSRQALALVSEKYYGYPSQKLRLIGVTGTNGKTTTTYLIDSILREHGKRVGLIGTVVARVGRYRFPVAHTTPESVDLQRYLSIMLQESLDYAVLEVSSHALALGRVAGCEFDIAVFTNLTQDHLDLHGDMQSYMETKARLFESLEHTGKPNKAAIINADDPAKSYVLSRVQVPVITYGIQHPASVSASHIVSTAQGVTFQVYRAKRLLGTVSLATPGKFSVYNALAAISVALHEQIPWGSIAKALQESSGIPGRFQPICKGQPFEIIVDYAHTPDGLYNILTTAREFADGRIILVFGCGGDRDNYKRPQMGSIASELADIIVLTSDNPRSEDPLQIIVDILQGVDDNKRVVVEPDRAEAIAQAIALAKPGDVVILAGKGHENYQVFADRTIYFDDREVAAQAVEALKI